MQESVNACLQQYIEPELKGCVYRNNVLKFIFPTTYKKQKYYIF